jgi:hypothetical protein
MHAAAAAMRETLDDPAGGRERLKRRLSDVVRDTHDEFGDPLGLLMVYLAASQNAEKTVRLTGDRIATLEAKSPSA